MIVLKLIRVMADIDIKLMSQLLNVSTYAYDAFEQGQRTVPDEIVPMIAKIYQIDGTLISENLLDDPTLLQLAKIKKMPKNEKKAYLTKNLLGDGVKLSYRNVDKMKKKILEEIHQSKDKDITSM